MSAVEPVTLTRDQALGLTQRIRASLGAMLDRRDQVLELIREARAGRAHEALGFDSWTAYVADEFADALPRLTLDERRVMVQGLAAEGLSTRAIAPVLGVDQKTVVRDLRAGEALASPAPDSALIQGDADAGPQGEVVPERVASASPQPRPAVTGLDGKTYPRPVPPLDNDAARARRDHEDRERGVRDSLTYIAESVRFLDGGKAGARIFLDHTYPRESDFLAPGMQLTAARLDRCIEFLTALRQEVTQ